MAALVLGSILTMKPLSDTEPSWCGLRGKVRNRSFIYLFIYLFIAIVLGNPNPIQPNPDLAALVQGSIPTMKPLDDMEPSWCCLRGKVGNRSFYLFIAIVHGNPTPTRPK